jgi:hypothetical protein
MKLTQTSFALAALALAAQGASAATCPTTALCLNDTVTYNGSTGSNTVTTYPGMTVNSLASGGSYTVGDAFGSVHPLTPTTLFPDSEVTPHPTGGTYNFYDDFFFTTTGSTTDDVAVISGVFTNTISNLQARIFNSDGPLGPTNGAPTLGRPTTGTGVDGWSSPVGNGSLSIILPTSFGPGTYDLQIRGDALGSAGSYGGSFNLQPVPLPAALPLLLSGFGLLGGLFRRKAQ